MGLLYAVIASGFNVTGDIDLRKHDLAGIVVPTINSGDLAVQGNVDATSANFMRMLDSGVASGDPRFVTVTGSRYIPWPAGMHTPPYVRFETILGGAGSAQTDNRSFTLATIPRR